ncbi:hypothetical protein ES703_116100 [subsurface metagenome]
MYGQRSLEIALFEEAHHVRGIVGSDVGYHRYHTLAAHSHDGQGQAVVS